MKTKRNTVILIICIVIGLIIIVAFKLGIHFTNTNSQKKGDMPSSPATAYGPGNSFSYEDGKITMKFISSNENNSTLQLSFLNMTSEDWIPRMRISGLKPINGTETETGYVICDYYTLVNKSYEFSKSSESEHSFILNDKLKITTDGLENDDCVIPSDGKEHIVEIDYSFFKTNDIIFQNHFLTVDWYTLWLEQI